MFPEAHFISLINYTLDNEVDYYLEEVIADEPRTDSAYYAAVMLLHYYVRQPDIKINMGEVNTTDVNKLIEVVILDSRLNIMKYFGV